MPLFERWERERIDPRFELDSQRGEGGRTGVDARRAQLRENLVAGRLEGVDPRGQGRPFVHRRRGGLRLGAEFGDPALGQRLGKRRRKGQPLAAFEGIDFPPFLAKGVEGSPILRVVVLAGGYQVCRFAGQNARRRESHQILRAGGQRGETRPNALEEEIHQELAADERVDALGDDAAFVRVEGPLSQRSIDRHQRIGLEAGLGDQIFARPSVHSYQSVLFSPCDAPGGRLDRDQAGYYHAGKPQIFLLVEG